MEDPCFSNNCLIVLPAYPATRNGVQDFAGLLASALSLQIGINFHFLPLFSVSEKIIFKRIAPFSLIHLHYVGYGYSRNGIPRNLLVALEKWKLKEKNKLLITFHELFAESHFPWKKSFYLQHYQKILFRRLSKIADFSVSSCQAFGLHFPGPVFILPVFSNIPVPENIFPFEMRSDNAVIWGNLEAKQSAYSHLHNYYPAISKNWRWTKIIDIGIENANPRSLPIPVIHVGFLKAEEISCLLSSCKYAVFTAYSPDYFSKSGIFAAFASHGLAVLTAPIKDADKSPSDGLLESVHFQSMHQKYNQAPSILAANLTNWYKEHRLENHVKKIYLPIIRNIVSNYFRH